MHRGILKTPCRVVRRDPLQPATEIRCPSCRSLPGKVARDLAASPKSLTRGVQSYKV
ncbi:hypothetical protein CGRA01v4_11492 [Colletotrichum graminicola]|nr:hypothetical protein CGRA01v4_11492 [Colletotrichum graminicola]